MPTTAEYQEMLAGGCPWCGEALVLKRGKNGEFIACQNWCGWTKSVPGRSDYQPPPKTSCPYKKCNGTGLLPYLKDGKVIPHAYLHCDCNQNYGIDVREHYRDTQPYDFDFPASQDFRSYYEVDSGRPDTQYREPEYRETESPVIESVRAISPPAPPPARPPNKPPPAPPNRKPQYRDGV